MFGGVGAILAHKSSEDPDFYKILGCAETATPEQIMTEYKVRALKCHPDKNAGNQDALKEFQKLQEARDTLTDSEKRKSYDDWKKCGVSLSFEQWKHLKNKCQMTMHWATPNREIMIEGTSSSTRIETKRSPYFNPTAPHPDAGNVKWGPSCADGWEHDNGATSNVFNAFRDYKI